MSVSEYLRRLDHIHKNSSNLHELIKGCHGYEKILIEKCKTFEEEIYDKIYTLDEFCERSLSRIGARRVKIENIRDILNKCEISVIFVGSVSSGKSKIINSILEEEVLPSSIGVTTTKIVKLIGSDQGKCYIKKCDRDFKDKEDLYEEIMNVSTDELDDKDDQALIEAVICNPKKSILNDKTFLIDTPGYNGNERAKDLVMEMCQRSDIIVFVMMYVFSDEEKEMFKMISEKTSKLNLFILVNKLDESDSDESFTVEMSKGLIERRLVDGLHTDNDTDKNRIFFISAKEQMDSFMGSEEEINEFRRNEFKRFIKELEKTLSNPKFCKCLKHEKDIIAMETDMETDFDNTEKALSDIIKTRTKFIDELQKVLNHIQDQEVKIKNFLTYEKESKLLVIKNHQQSKNILVRTFQFLKPSNNNPKKDSDILKIDETAETFDKFLNDLEEQVGEKVKSIVDVLQEKLSRSTQLADQDLLNLTFQSDSDPHGIATGIHFNGSQVKRSNKTKNKFVDENNKLSVWEEQVLSTFDDFNKTITARCQLMHTKTERLFNAIEGATNGLKIQREKFT